MGQYFSPVVGLKDLSGNFVITGWVHPHDFDCGLKFMEHGYTTTSVVSTIMNHLLIPKDVAPAAMLCKRLVWAGDYEEVPEGEQTTFDKARDFPDKKLPKAKFNQRIRYIVNVEKKEFVDVQKCPFIEGGWRISPLAVLTATEMPRGGGDYRGQDSEMIGRWKYDLIYTSTNKTKIPKGYTELLPKFQEI